MRFAKNVFLIAGIYGVLVMAPMYFMEAKTGIDYPPAITHPEYYYGFVGVTLAWQFAFLLMSRDPIKYRMLMPVAMFEKFSYVVALIFLLAQNRVPAIVSVFGAIDFVLGVLFVMAFVKTKNGVNVASKNP